MALFSFLVSGASVAGAWYLYKNTDTLIEEAREKVIEEVAEALPKIVEKMMPDIPEFPTATGEVVPQLPSTTGGAIPSGSGLPLPTNLEFFKTK